MTHPAWPEGVHNIDLYRQEMVLSSTINQIDAGHAPNPDGLIDTLTDVMADPFVLHDGGDIAPSAAITAWRLGIAHNLSSLVLRNISQLSVIDPDFIGITRVAGDGSRVAMDLLESNPSLLHGLTGRDEEAFWGLTGFDPNSLVENQSAALDLDRVMTVLRHASFVPERIINSARLVRDNFSNLSPKAEQDFEIPGAEVVFQPDELDPREQELEEATIRLLFGAFVAEHSGGENDYAVLERTVTDLSNALADLGGTALAANIGVLNQVRRKGLSKQGRGDEILQVLRENVDTFAAAFRVENILLPESVRLANVTHGFLALHPNADSPGMRRLLERLTEQLVSFQELDRLGLDPPPEEATTADIIFANTRPHVVTYVLNKIRGERPRKASPEDVMSRLASGYRDVLAFTAFQTVASEFDADKRAALFNGFDQAIREGLAKLSDDSLYLRPDGLVHMNAHGTPLLGYLASFPAGSEFVHNKLDQLLSFARSHIKTPSDWLAENNPNHTLVSWARAIQSALWYNLPYYAQEPEARAITKKALTVQQLINTYVMGHLSSDSDEIVPQLESIDRNNRLFADHLKNLIRSADEPQIDPVHPLLAILRQFRRDPTTPEE